eukprot:511554_1
MDKLLFVYTSVACLVLATTTDELRYYVSTTGSDATGDGSQSNPWATIQNAQNNVQKVILTLNKSTHLGNITININSGMYKGPLSFGVQDSMRQNPNYMCRLQYIFWC